MRDLRGVASYEAPALAHAAGHPRRRSSPSKPRANLWERLHNTRLHSPVNPDGRRAVIGDAIHQLSYEVPLPRAELPINRRYRQEAGAAKATAPSVRPVLLMLLSASSCTRTAEAKGPAAAPA